jgi:hypothetical protein
VGAGQRGQRHDTGLCLRCERADQVARLADPGRCGGVGGGFPGLATIDVVSYHYYTNYGQTGWQSTQQAAAAAGKPWYIGECGFSPSSSRPQEFQSLLSSVFNASNSAGFVAWQFANQGGDGFDIGTGDPALPVLNSFA